ncbi:nuclear transport factor 2 family protein [Nonomuraea sp. NPDC050547]|uniref:nuclear transport factor 2 family protein n=1 Tax=unclassified Nonomuraea TaxID=2593643 RepID=UPI00379C2146
MTANNPVVAAFVAAINEGDRAAFEALLAPDATMSDDGSERDLGQWTEREIFSAAGRFTVESQEPDGLSMLARFRNDTWGEMKTRWRFVLTPDGSKIQRFETGQA